MHQTRSDSGGTGSDAALLTMESESRRVDHMRVPQRGRAILRRLYTHEPGVSFRPGDFLLTSSDGGLARLLGWATGAALNHAALIIDTAGSIVEATPAFLADPHPFRISSIFDYLHAGKPCWIGYVELRQGSRQDVVAYARHLLRAQSSGFLAGRLWQAVHTLIGIAPRSWSTHGESLAALNRFLDQHAIILRDGRSISSGELVAHALERGGFVWDRDPAYVTPAHLFSHFHQAETAAPKVRFDRRGIATHRRSAQRAFGQAPMTPHSAQDLQSAPMLRNALPHPSEPQHGIQGLAQVGIFMAASLAVIGLLEEAIRLLIHDA